jgi:hypothetical protein
MENESYEPSTSMPVRGTDSAGDQLEATDSFEANLDAYAADTPARRDGWTPFSRKLFLAVLSETGRVSLACEYTGLTRQSAYALRARDPLFAAGWDAACELARAPLADALYEKAIDGVTDTITKDGEVVAERHRHDSRLSIAVLHRLDKRCDRAEERGADHLALVRNWDEWLSLVGKGEDRAAQALLESARHCQNRQLPESGNPTEPEFLDLSDRCWIDDDMWLTDFPPPPGFVGYESGPWDEGDYERACTPEEVAILEADQAADAIAARAEEEALRDAWFEMLREEAQRHPDEGQDPSSGRTATAAIDAESSSA